MESKKPTVSIIAAIGKGAAGERVIGKGNTLLWRIPDDLKRFKALTLGHPVIMGRRTFESIVGMLGKPLPGRTNIVITRSQTSADGRAANSQGGREQMSGEVLYANSLEEALERARELDDEETFVIGGGQIYEQALPFVDRLYLTLIDNNPVDAEGADTFFPPYETIFTKKIFEEAHEHNGLKYTWVTLEK